MTSASVAHYGDLADRVVLITGGASGIGAAMVEAFTRQGANVAFLDVAAEAGEALADGLRDGAHPPTFLPCDLTDIAALRDAVARVGERLGDVGVLVNNAANDARHAVAEVEPDGWDASMAVNLRHQFFAAQAVAPMMAKLGGGAIVNFSSIAWMRGGADMIAYSTAKAGVIGLTNSLAREFGADGIRVNAIAPGAVMTERQLRLWYSEDQADAVAKRQILKRRLLPEHVADAALFLASDASAMITKTCLVVDAGLI